MNGFRKASVDEIEDGIEEIYDNGVALSNYFNADVDGFEYLKTEKSILLKKDEVGFSRVYFLTNDVGDLTSELSRIETTTVINIPSKDGIAAFEPVLEKSGFKPYRVYEVYENHEFRGNDVFRAEFASGKDLERVKFLLYDQLDTFADHLPSDETIAKFIANNQVLVNYENDEICGIFIFTVQGKKCYFNYWVDLGSNGLFLLLQMYDWLKEQNIAYSYLWVDTQNQKVKRIHTLLGSRPNGTKDYIYTK
ncbi:MAG: hypothetical protein EOO50_13860 [Flavobacterium sp.]|uniref:hypothetical protein n=1 Tax=Flavobacterium sp. TaxID=239 RepID=UPI00121B0F27|nr:hypothetical protein [Flavobacterium sp.]RZJ65404.1 MAG: hypothetical protein EOO50_13860 [Flavobacterium sp.]